MPYYPQQDQGLGALIGAAATYFGTKQQIADEETARKDQELRTQIAMATYQQGRDDLLRQRGIDPDTGEPFTMPADLQRVVPGKVGPNYKVTPQDLYQHQMRLAQWYSTTGQTGSADLAAKQAENIQTEQMRLQSEDAALTKGIILSNLVTRRDMSMIQPRLNAAITLKGTPSWQNLNLSPYQQQDLAIRAANAATTRAGKVTADQAQAAESKWYEDWNKAISPGQKTMMNPNPVPKVNPTDANRARKVFSLISGSTDPLTVANKAAAREPNPTLKALILDRGRVANMQRQAYGQAGGGSNVTVPPPQFQP